MTAMTSTEPRKGLLPPLLEKAPAPVFVVFAILTAFTTYFCMYAFRKPFAAATFKGQYFFGSLIELKTAIVISQIIGYALSKYVGVKICSEISDRRRARLLVLLILWAEAALVLFGLLPNNLKVFAIFLNGFPLGMVWGLVVRYLEGRRTSELLLAGLSCSYIISSGIVKDVGRAVVKGAAADWWGHVPVIGPAVGGLFRHVGEGWMPALVGLHFLPLFLLAVWLLNQLPQPNQADVAARVEREPMLGSERLAFIKQFLFGLIVLCVAYFFLTAYRDFRDNYQVEIFTGLGYPYAANKTIISKAETLVMFGVMAALALLNLIKNNRLGLIGAFAIMTFGVGLLGVSTFLLQSKMINGFWWMTLTGLGSYLAYVPYGSVLFDRLIASTRVVATAVFAIYVADAIGYTGSVGVQLYRDILESDISRLGFFIGFTYFMSFLGLVCLVSSCVYFLRQGQARATASTPTPVPATMGPQPE
jgi:MFS family permease